LLVDPLVNDVETLATINPTLIASGITAGEDQQKVVPYIFVAARTPNRIGEIAQAVYRESYSGLRGMAHSRDLALLRRLVGADVSGSAARVSVIGGLGCGSVTGTRVPLERVGARCQSTDDLQACDKSPTAALRAGGDPELRPAQACRLSEKRCQDRDGRRSELGRWHLDPLLGAGEPRLQQAADRVLGMPHAVIFLVDLAERLRGLVDDCKPGPPAPRARSR
jgi:hypothetical protein